MKIIANCLQLLLLHATLIAALDSYIAKICTYIRLYIAICANIVVVKSMQGFPRHNHNHNQIYTGQTACTDGSYICIYSHNNLFNLVVTHFA